VLVTGDQPRDPTSDSASEPIPRTSWLALIVTTLVFFLVVIDVSAVNVAFPSIGDDFGVSESSLSWIISGYNIVVAAFLLVAGRLADSLGRKKLFIPGVAVFMTGSFLSGAAPSATWLIAARVIQAIGGAIIAPTAIAVILPDFPPNKRSTVIGITGATGGLGAVAGPAVGSLLIDVWSWRGIFWINVPICLLVLAISPKLLRESKNPNATGKIDFLGVPIGTAAIALIMFSIVQSERWGVTDPRALGLFVAGMALIPWLLHRSARHPEPLIELDLFRYASFRSVNAGVALYSLAFTSGFLANSLLLQRLWGQNITTTGKALIAAPLLSAAFAPLSGRLADRIGHRWILAAGSGLCGFGYLLFYLYLDGEPAVYTRYVPISLLVGVGVGTTIATWASAGLSDVQPAQFGTANATLRTTQQVFYALGISIVVTLLAAGTGAGGLEGFQWAWLFVAAAYGLSAIVIAITFPSGNSDDRLA
jgi:EmrB/QacA subfamily drug resistance transporter